MDLSTTLASLRKKVAGLSLVTLVAGMFATGVATAATNHVFSDVPADAWFSSYVNGLASDGVVDSSKDMYRPGDLVNRAEMAKFAFSVSGLALETAPSAPFKDVAMGQWYTNYIYTLAKNNVVSGDKKDGVPTGTFRPMDALNRAEATKMLVNAAQLAEDLKGAPHFPDVKSSDWFYNFVETAFNKGVVAGYPDGTFGPAKNINRAEAAKMVYMAMHGVVSGFTLDSAAAASKTEVELIFSANVDQTSAETFANYSIEDSTGKALAVTAAAVTSSDTVHLTTATQNAGTTYYVVAKNVKSSSGDAMSNNDAVSFLGYGADVSGGALSIALSTQTPVSGAVPKGAAGVVFTCWDVKAGAEAAVLKSLRVTRVGPGNSTDFDNVYLYRGDSRLTSGRSINSETQAVEFNNVNQTIAAGESAKFCLVADMGTVNGGVHAFQITSAADVMTNSSDLTGSFPLRGADQLITDATVGSLDVYENGSLDDVSVGQKDARISQFELKAGAEEKVSLQRLALYVRGSVSRGDISNFKLYNLAGEKLAEVASVNSSDLAVFVLSKPYVLETGETKIFYVTADVVGARNADTVKTYFDEATDIYAQGVTYGYGVPVTIDNLGGYDGSAGYSEVTVKGSDFTITSNPLTSTEVVLNQDNAVCLDLNLANAKGSEVTISDWSFDVEDPIGTNVDPANLKQFKLVKLNEDGSVGATILGPKELTGASNPETITLPGDYTIAPDTTVRAGLVFDVSDAADINGQVKCTLNPVTTGDKVVDQNNDALGEAAITPNAAISGNVLDVEGSQLTITRSTDVQATAYSKGTNNAGLLSLQFKAGTAQSQVLKELALKIYSVNDASGNNDGVMDNCATDTCLKPSDSVMNVQLLDGATVLATQNVVNGSAATGLGDINFKSLSVNIPKGSNKVLTVRANVSNTATADMLAVYVNGVVAVDGQGRTTTAPDFISISAYTNAPLMLIATPTVTVGGTAMDSLKRVAAGEETFQTLNFKLRSEDGNTTLQDLTFAATVGSEINAIKSVTMHPLTAGVCGSVISTGTVNTANSTVSFDNVGLALQSNKDTSICVKIVSNSISGSSELTSGEYIGLTLKQDNSGSLDADGEITDLRDSTNTNIASSIAGFTITSDVDTVIYRSVPSLAHLDIGGTLSSGIIDMAKFTLGKTGEDLDLTQLHFDFSSTGLDAGAAGMGIDSCKLYNGATLVASATSDDYTTAEFDGMSYTVNGLKTLTLKCTVVVDASSTTTSVGVTLDSDTDTIEWDDGDGNIANKGDAIVESPISWSLN